MSHYHQALRRYRVRPAREARTVASALCVTCAESAAVTAFLAAIEPVLVLQNLGGEVPPRRPAPGSDTAAIEWALGEQRVTSAILAGHSGCRFHAFARGAAPLSLAGELLVDDRFSAADLASQASLLVQERHLREQARALGAGVEAQLLWFQEEEGDVWWYQPGARRFTLASDLDLERLFSAIGRRS